jgi:hypothetical protein
MTTQKRMQDIIIIGSVLVGVILYVTSQRAPERTFAQVIAQTQPAKPTPTPTPTKWLDGLCRGEEYNAPSPYSSPAKMYEAFQSFGWHVELIDHGDAVKIEATVGGESAGGSEWGRTFYRTMAACKAAKAADAAAVERHERSLDKYRSDAELETIRSNGMRKICTSGTNGLCSEAQKKVLNWLSPNYTVFDGSIIHEADVEGDDNLANKIAAVMDHCTVVNNYRPTMPGPTDVCTSR